MPREILIGLVGKPSAGKSTTLNSICESDAKVGNFPFTTIEPNRAVGFVLLPCAHPRFASASCRPLYGSCDNGTRSIPIQLLDVAGLVPGAHQGRGLGNRFLDDLRLADCLVHVVDASGRTDAEGKETRGYDPTNDIVWLREEIVQWIQGNLMEKWNSIKRRHVTIKATPAETLQSQFSGYGSKADTVARVLDRLKIAEPLEQWDDITIGRVVNGFVDLKFPTVIALNKIDSPDADTNIARIAKKHDAKTLVLMSAIGEVFLRKLERQGFVKYSKGSDLIETHTHNKELKPMDAETAERVDELDMLLYRFGGTGVNNILTRATKLLELVPFFPVKSIHSPQFRDCILVKRGTTVSEVARRLFGEIKLAYVEGIAGRVSEDDSIDGQKNDVLSFKFGAKNLSGGA